MNTAAGRLRAQIQELRFLPPLPAAAPAILQVFADEEADIDAVERAVALEPGMAARIVGLANSAYYGNQGRIFTIRAAIIKALGLRLVKDLALSLLMAQNFRLRAGRAFRPEAFWLRAVTVAKAAALLAGAARPCAGKALGRRPKNAANAEGAAQAYLGGLLHQLGIAALAHLAPEEMDQVLLEVAARQGASLASLEEARFGMSHQSTGVLLARKWHLPEEVISVIGHYHDPDYDGHHGKLVSVVHAACLLHEALEQGETTMQFHEHSTSRWPELGLDAERVGGVLSGLRQEQEGLRLMAAAMSGAEP
ncbi:MAG: HDOD domain-containing protein [Pseudomonadota bacterium]